MGKTDDGNLIAYLEQFIRNDKYNALYFCRKWCNLFNSGKWRVCQPEDILFKVLEAVYEGRRKCYLTSYTHFKNSIYYALKWELLNALGIREKKVLTEDSPENYFLPEILTDTEGAYEGGEILIAEINKRMIIEKIGNIFDPDIEWEELMVYEEILNGGKREDIAISLGLDVQEVTNIQKRIFRKIENRIKRFSLREAGNGRRRHSKELV